MMGLESLYISMYVGTDEETINEINLYDSYIDTSHNKEHDIKEEIKWLSNLNSCNNITYNVIYFSFEPIQQVVETRRLNLFKRLINEHTINVKHVDKYTQSTTLHILTSVPDIEHLIIFLNCVKEISFIKKYIKRADEMLLCKSVYIAIFREILRGNKYLTDNDLKLLEEKISEDELEIAKILIRKGINIDMQDINGYTALRNSIINRNIKLVKLLLENNANSKIKYFNSTIFELSVISRRLDIVELVSSTCGYDKCSNILHRAVINNDSCIVKFLLDIGLNINSRNILKKTPIHNSVSSGYINITKMLIDYGADINAIDNNGNTPLMLASSYPEIVMLLLESGADTRYVNKRKETALNIAISKHHSKTSSIMIPYIILQIYKSQYDKNEGNEINDNTIKNHEELLFIKTECEKEIKDMKYIKLNSIYSLDIFLISDNIQLLSKLVNNNNVSSTDTLSFKNYGSMLETSIKKALIKRKKFDKYFSDINFILTSNKYWYYLPYEIKYRIMCMCY